MSNLKKIIDRHGKESKSQVGLALFIGKETKNIRIPINKYINEIHKENETLKKGLKQLIRLINKSDLTYLKEKASEVEGLIKQ